MSTSDQTGMTCAWCHAAVDPSMRSCPNCGAATDVRRQRSDGWEEQPAIPDMARIQFGASRAQIEGAYVPVVDATLAERESVYFTHDRLLWRDGTVELKAMKVRGVWKRARAGMPLVMMEAHGPGRIAFSHDLPGEIVALPLAAGANVFAREHHMLLASGQVQFEGANTPCHYITGSGDDSEYHYPLGQYVDRFFAATPGLVLLHAAGNVFTRTLAAGEAIQVAGHSLLAYTDQVSLALAIEEPAGGGWQQYVSLLATGPGRVWIQSGTHGETRVTNLRGGYPLVTFRWRATGGGTFVRDQTSSGFSSLGALGAAAAAGAAIDLSGSAIDGVGSLLDGLFGDN
jgi:uncharacterized protein (AIM24 family)